MNYKICFIILIFSFSWSPVKAWDGFDYQTGGYVEIESGNLVRPGKEIEVFDYNTGSYKYYDVESVNSTGSGAEVEVYDYNTGEYKSFDME